MINYVEYKELKITHDFMFTKIFSSPKFAHKLMEILLDMEIDEVIVETQVTLGDLEKSKTIKLDILVRIGNDYYNIEMQNYNKDNLIKRAIYYRNMIVKHALSSGQQYETLPTINVIFICNFDLYKKGLPRYTFSNCCHEDSDLNVPEYGFDMYLTIHRYAKETNIPLQNLLKYFYSQVPCDQFTNELDIYLKQCLQDELWKDDYMKYGLEMQKLQKEYEAIGEARGEAIGEARGDMLKSLKLAKKMLNDKDLDYIADFCEIPLVCVQALNDGCTIEILMEQYFEYD